MCSGDAQLLDKGKWFPAVAYVQVVLWPLLNIQVIVYKDKHVLVVLLY